MLFLPGGYAHRIFLNSCLLGTVWNVQLQPETAEEELMVRKAGLEPACLSAPPPQYGVSANSTTSALLSPRTPGLTLGSQRPVKLPKNVYRGKSSITNSAYLGSPSAPSATHNCGIPGAVALHDRNSTIQSYHFTIFENDSAFRLAPPTRA